MIIGITEFPAIREKYLDGIIVFCSGSFDLIHTAHVKFLRSHYSFKDSRSHLVVAVASDKMISCLKPGRPINDEMERLKMVNYVIPGDYCYLDTASTPNEPLACLSHAFKNLKPDVYMVNDEAFDLDVRRSFCEAYGVEMKILKRDWESISTTKIIEKVLDANTGKSQ